MNHIKNSSSEPENEDHSMEWEEDEGIGACVGEDRASSFDLNVTSGYAFSQPSTSGYTGQKRKLSFSSPLPPKFSRNIWNGKQQQEEHSSVNETNNREVASGFSTVPSANPISSSFNPNISSGYALSQPSTSGYTSRKSSPPARISRDIWSGKQQHEDNSSLNKTSPYNNREVASGFATVPPIPQMMQVEPHLISSQAKSDKIHAAVLVADATDCSSLNKTSPYNNREVASGFATAPPFPQMVQTNPYERLNIFLRPEHLKRKIIRLLNLDESPPDTNSSKSKTDETLSDRERLDFLYENEKKFCDNFKLPESSREALRRHLRHHGINEISDNFDHFIPLRESNCMICKIFFAFLAHPI